MTAVHDDRGKTDSKKRIFIAMPAGPEVGKALSVLLKELSGFKKFIRVVAPENFHVTLKFLGGTEIEIFDRIMDTFRDIDINSPRIECTVRGLGAFPNPVRPSVLWVGLITDSKAIAGFQEKIEKFAAGFGFPEEKREFTPHLTVARIRRGARTTREFSDYIKNNADTFYTESNFDRVSLFESVLTPKGAQYRELASLPLSGAAS